MTKKIFILTLIFVMSNIIGCGKREEKKVYVLPPQIPMEKPELYVPEQYEYKSVVNRDPFEPLIVSDAKTRGKEGVRGVDISEIDIANLELSGIVWDRKESMAILHDGNKFGYILKRGRLLADNFRPITGISGKILGNKNVFLQQGKTEVNFFLEKPKMTKIKGADVAALSQKEIEIEEIQEEKKKF